MIEITRKCLISYDLTIVNDSERLLAKRHIACKLPIGKAAVAAKLSTRAIERPDFKNKKISQRREEK